MPETVELKAGSFERTSMSTGFFAWS